MLFALHGAERGSAYLNLLMLGGFGGLVAAAGVAWTLSRGVANVFRRAMAGMVAVGGAAFVGALTIVADAAGGRFGLLALAAICIAVMVLAYRGLLPR
jgi:hypothetical protein